MVKYKTQILNSTFSALSDPTRRAILRQLAHGESTVMDLAEPFEISLPAISKHLRVLEEARLIAREKDGRVHRIRLEVEPLRDASKWIDQYSKFWEEQLDRLAIYLNDLNEKETSWSRNRKTSKPAYRSSERSRHPVKRSSKPGPPRKK